MMNFKSNICNIVTFNLLAWIIEKKENSKEYKKKWNTVD